MRRPPRSLPVLAAALGLAPRLATAQPATALCRARDRPAGALAGTPANRPVVEQAYTDAGTQIAVGRVLGDSARCVGRALRWGAATYAGEPWRGFLALPDSGVMIAIGDYVDSLSAAQAIVAAQLAGVQAADTLALLIPNSAYVPPSYLGAAGRPQALPLTGISRTAEPPRRLVDTRPPAFGPGCRRLPVVGLTMAAVQAAADSALPCDVVELVPQRIYAGKFRLKRRAGARAGGVITIATAGGDTLAPAVGEKVTAVHAARYGVLRTSQTNEPTVVVDSAAYGWRLFAVTLDVAPNIKSQSRFVDANGERWRNGSTLPRRITFDRVAMIGHDSLQVNRCLMFDGADWGVVDSRLYGCHDRRKESQAINAAAGPGAIAIINNLLEGSGENVMFGGYAPRWGNPYYGGTLLHTISDIEISRNLFYKNPAWRSPKKYIVKNLFELKFAERVLGQGNVFENTWYDGQQYAWTFKRSGEYPYSTSATVADVTMRFNRVYNAPTFVAITAWQGSEKLDTALVGQRPTTRITIAHTQADSIYGVPIMLNAGDSVRVAGRPRSARPLLDVALVHNSITAVPHPSNCGTTLQFGQLGRWGDRLTLRDNVLQKCKYGINPNGTSSALAERFTTYQLTGNVLGGFSTGGYSPTDIAANHFYSTIAAALASLGVTPGAGGPGADLARVRAATWGVQPATLDR